MKVGASNGVIDQFPWVSLGIIVKIRKIDTAFLFAINPRAGYWTISREPELPKTWGFTG